MSTVVVTRPDYDALDWPAFLIKVDDPNPGNPAKYYLTLAVWEYNPADAGGDAVKIAGCNWAQTEYGMGTPTAGAVFLRDAARGAVGGSGNQTSPIRPS